MSTHAYSQSTLPPFLTDSEIDGICAGLSQGAAMIRYLRRLGLPVERKPNGRPLVRRVDWERRKPLATSQRNPKWREGPTLVISARFLREGCEISQALRQESRSTPTKGVLLMQNQVPSIQSGRNLILFPTKQAANPHECSIHCADS